MQAKKIALILVIIAILCGAVFSANPISVLVLELSYTTFPVIVADKLQDVKFTFQATRYFQTMPTYQFMSGYKVVEGAHKLSFWDLCLNFTLDIEVRKDVENGTLWRSFHFVFSSVVERKFQIYVQKPANATLEKKAVIIVDGRLVAWYEGEIPYIDKTIHKTFAIDIPTGT